MTESVHTAAIGWKLGDGEDFPSGRYSRLHDWTFDGGARVVAAASPHVVRPPWTDPGMVDPEEAFVAALASCHMLFFLSVAAREGVIVECYDDAPDGVLASDKQGGRLTGVTLRPRATTRPPLPADRLDELHARAHAACFLARSVAFPVTWIIRPDADAPS